MKKIALLIILSLTLSSCAHHMDVRAGENGIHRVEVRADSRDFAPRSALSQANDFCKERNQYAVILEENVQYVGSMSETAYNAARTASNVATAAGVGTGIYALAKNKSSKSKTAKVAALATAGGLVGKAIVNDGYVAQMRFKCQQ